jgi:ribA/ribD-fused uncharacterized protein
MTNQRKLMSELTGDRYKGGPYPCPYILAEVTPNNTLGFYGHGRRTQLSGLSNWYMANFVFTRSDGTTILFYTSEQYMMWAKARLFGDTAIAARILAEGKNPRKAKELGRLVAGFDFKRWSFYARSIVEHGVWLKFSQNKDIREVLLNTGDTVLVEAALNDALWGVGTDKNGLWANGTRSPDGWGKNWLGQVLMNVRTRLREQECLSPVPNTTCREKFRLPLATELVDLRTKGTIRHPTLSQKSRKIPLSPPPPQVHHKVFDDQLDDEDERFADYEDEMYADEDDERLSLV